jgi:hypothetical protein
LLLLQERETGAPVSLFKCFVDTRTLAEPHPDRPELGTWVNEGAKNRSESYTEGIKGKYGAEAEPKDLPFDSEVAVLVGEGMKNGRLWIGDGCVPPASIPSLTKARAANSGSSVGTRPRPGKAKYSVIEVCSCSLMMHNLITCFP